MTGVVIIVLLVVFFVKQQIDSAVQTAALKKMAEVEEKRLYLEIQKVREKKRDEVITDPKNWLSEMSGYKVMDILKVVQDPKAISLMAVETGTGANAGEIENIRIVVSPLGPKDLKRELKRVEHPGKGMLARFRTPDLLLGKPKWFGAVPFVERSLGEAGHYFEIQAGKIGTALKLDWGEPEKLYFYYVEN